MCHQMGQVIPEPIVHWRFLVVVAVAAMAFVLISMALGDVDPCTDYGPHTRTFVNEVDLCGNRTNSL